VQQLQVRAWKAQLQHLRTVVDGDTERQKHRKRRAERLGQILGSLLGIFLSWYLQPHLFDRMQDFHGGDSVSLGHSSLTPREAAAPGTSPLTRPLQTQRSSFLPFSSTEVLQAAVDEYMVRGHPSHTVSQVYGWPIGKWNVSAVTNFTALFSVDRNPNARSFNADLSSWDVSNATTLRKMFQGAQVFDQNLSSWNTSRVTDMSSLFQGAHSFNGSIADWDTSALTTMDRMFAGALVFQQNISAWNTKRVTRMSLTFSQAYAFDQDLSAWKTSRVTNMQHMFFSATKFNGNLSTWDVANVRTMHSMFRNAHQFNMSIGNWQVSLVHDMSNMFQEATRFDQDLSQWSVVNLIRAPQMFQKSALQRDLCAWRHALPRKANVTNMFHLTPCLDSRDPDMSATIQGPFCVPCNERV
jgi:surface protein